MDSFGEARVLEILQGYPALRQDDLHAAWEYARQHPQEIEDASAGQEAQE